MKRVSVYLALALALGALLPLAVSAQTTPSSAAEAKPSHVDVQPGYFLERFAHGLDFPTAIAFSSDHIWVSEAGFLPGFAPKVKQLDLSGHITTLLSATQLPAGKLLGPLTDVTFHDDWLWITHRQKRVHGWAVGAISKFDPRHPVRSFTTVITNLPAAGDHYPEEIIFD